MHAIEKILAKASGREKVVAGETVMVKVDLAEVNDIYLQTIKSFHEMGGKKVWDRDKLVFVFDHYAPSPTIDGSVNHALMRDFIKTQGLKHHFDIEKGICHQVLPEAGLVYPGMVLVATDSHTTTHGAFGAFGTGVGATDLATIMISGELWVKVPEIINIKIEGEPNPITMAKDIALYIVGQLKADGAIYQAVEYSGSYVDSLSVASRMVLCNLAVEMGAKTAYIQPNDTVISYLKSRVPNSFEIFKTDEGYQYQNIYTFDIDGLKPQIAIPGSVDNVVPLFTIEPIIVDQCFIGTCTGGREEDLQIAASVIGDRKIASSTRFLVIPASDQVLMNCIADGTIAKLVAAGAVLASPGCGPCLGAHQGLLAPGEVCVSASNRNFPGRMGSREAKIYLASPAVVAESAVQGFIAQPATFESRKI